MAVRSMGWRRTLEMSVGRQKKCTFLTASCVINRYLLTPTVQFYHAENCTYTYGIQCDNMISTTVCIREITTFHAVSQLKLKSSHVSSGDMQGRSLYVHCIA